jgi:ABC-type antimicrobial peptide transport system permease subunit
MLATVVGGAIAFAAHGGKTAVRAAVTPSPEPISNAALSIGEDALAVFLIWFATQHPFITTGIVAILLIIIVAMVRFIYRALRNLFRGAEEELAH